MRLQLDATLAGVEAGRSGQVEQTGSTASSGSRPREPGVSGAEDSIQISSASRALDNLNTGQASRIQQLSAAVQNGSYNVSSSLISSAMVNDMATWPAGTK